MEAYLSNLTVFNHPLIKHKVSHLCDVNTGTKEFSELVKELAMLMGYETLKELKTKDVEIQAPLQKIITPVLAEDFTIVPILRAGLGMVDGLRELSPTAKVGHIGLYRDEETLKPMTYYFKLPVDTADRPEVLPNRPTTRRSTAPYAACNTSAPSTGIINGINFPSILPCVKSDFELFNGNPPLTHDLIEFTDRIDHTVRFII